MFSKKITAILLLLVISAALPFTWLACSKTSPTAPVDDTTTPATTQQVSTVTVTPDSAQVSVSGTQQFAAVATDSTGATINNQTFTWTSSNTSYATVSATGLVTGVAAGGPLFIIASAGNPVKSDTSIITVVTQSSTGSISVTTTPTGAQIYVDGTLKGTSPLTATLVPAGSHTVTAALAGYKNSSQVVSVTAGLTATVNLTLLSVGRAFNINMEALPTAIYVQGTGYQPSLTTIVTTVTDSLGDPTPGKTVYFTTSKYPGILSASSGVTDSAGQIVIYYTAGTTSGTVEIRASTPEIVTPIIMRITVLSGPPHPAHFSVVPSVLNIAGRVSYGLTDVITSYVFDRWGNPVPDNTMLWFWTDQAGITPGQTTTTNGIGSNTLISCAPTDTFAHITAETRDSAGNQIYSYCKVLLSGPTSVFDMVPSTFNVATGSSDPFIINVSDDYGMPVVGGSTISIALDGGGKVIPSSFEIPDALYPGIGTTQFPFYIIDESPTDSLGRNIILTITLASQNGSVVAVYFGTVQ